MQVLGQEWAAEVTCLGWANKALRREWGEEVSTLACLKVLACLHWVVEGQDQEWVQEGQGLQWVQEDQDLCWVKQVVGWVSQGTCRFSPRVPLGWDIRGDPAAQGTDRWVVR